MYDKEWEWYISRLYTKLLKAYYFVPETVVELAPGFKIKTALFLQDINFKGTLFVIDADKDVCKFVETEYKKFIPQAKIVTINKQFEFAITKLPKKIDLFLANHAIDDLIIDSYFKNKKQFYVQDDTIIKKAWLDLENEPEILNKISKRIISSFFVLFNTKKINFVLMSQYKSNVFLNDCPQAFDITKNIFNSIKCFVNLEDTNAFLPKIRPFGEDDERYNFASLIENVQGPSNWLIGKPRKNIKEVFNILKDPYYSLLFVNTQDYSTVIKAGFINYDDKIKYNTNLITTPINKITISDNTKNPIVLLSTGGFNPLHKGHISMLEKAKTKLESEGFDVVGAYFSPSHETYIKTKPDYKNNQFERLIYNYDLIKDSNWINIDTWESLCNHRYINFTTVIDRLEKYLQKFVRSDIKVAYVFGDDNLYFMDVFKYKGIGVCIKRKSISFDKVMLQYRYPNCFFVEEAPIDISSRNDRDIPDIQNSEGIYLVRNEGILPFEDFNVSKVTKIKAQNYFKTEFIKILQKYISNKIETVDVKNQLKFAEKQIKSDNVLSIDTYYKGKYNLNISRLFNICDFQYKNKCLIESPFSKPLQEQLKNIPKNSYTLVDDDSISGTTINMIKAFVDIENIVLLSSYIDNNIFDCIDLRDFIIGTKNSGLVVDFNNKHLRVPYIYPYVNLYTRANIIDVINFTKDILKLNRYLYKVYLPMIKIKDLDKSFIELCKIQEIDIDNSPTVFFDKILNTI